MVLPFTVGQWGRWRIEKKKKKQIKSSVLHIILYSSLMSQTVNSLPVMREIPGFDPWVGKIPCRRKWQPTLVFLPGESHGQRRLTGYRSWGHKESDTTEWLTDSVLLCSKRSILKDNNWQSKSDKESEENFRGQRPLLSCYTPGHLVPLFLVD